MKIELKTLKDGKDKLGYAILFLAKHRLSFTTYLCWILLKYTKEFHFYHFPTKFILVDFTVKLNFSFLNFILFLVFPLISY